MCDLRTVKEIGGDALEQFINLADQVFLFDRSRTGTLRERLPGLFRSENEHNLFALCRNGEVVGTAAVKEFSGRAHHNKYSAAMVGLVAIREDCRGQGLGAELITQVSEELARRSLDFCVLWTRASAFYRRAGWFSHDTGVLGYFRNPTPIFPCIGFSPLDMAAELEQIRNEWLPDINQRRAHDYAAIPSSVERVICVRPRRKGSAYALAGVQNDMAFIYEFAGDPTHYAEIWGQISSGFRVTRVNERFGANIYQWFVSNTSVTWEAQELAMWLLSNTDSHLDVKSVYVPYFDRI